MFSIRQFSYTFSRRIYSYSSNRYQSNTTNDLTNTSSSDKTKKTTWTTSDTNGLVKQLSARIKAGGPITVAEFMRESLLNPKYVRYLLLNFFSFLFISFYLYRNYSSQKYLVIIIILLGLLHTT